MNHGPDVTRDPCLSKVYSHPVSVHLIQCHVP